MPYIDKNGECKYSLKEKINYHNQCANTGKMPDGRNLTFTERQNHARASARCRSKLGKFMQATDMVERIQK